MWNFLSFLSFLSFNESCKTGLNLKNIFGEKKKQWHHVWPNKKMSRKKKKHSYQIMIKSTKIISYLWVQSFFFRARDFYLVNMLTKSKVHIVCFSFFFVSLPYAHEKNHWRACDEHMALLHICVKIAKPKCLSLKAAVKLMFI